MINRKEIRAPQQTFTFKLQYISGWCEPFQEKDIWERVFTIPGCKTLEYLRCLIINIMGWDPCHLYYFTVKGQKYVCSDFLDIVLDNIYEEKVISCDIKLLELGIKTGDKFDFLYLSGSTA